MPRWLLTQWENPNGIDALVTDCKEGPKKIPFVRIKHCYREANKCADDLARRGAILGQDFIVFIHPPSPKKREVELLLRLDALGTMYDHFVSFPFEALQFLMKNPFYPKKKKKLTIIPLQEKSHSITKILMLVQKKKRRKRQIMFYLDCGNYEPSVQVSIATKNLPC